MDPNKSLEQLLSAQPDNILQQLLAFNLMIQKADKQEVIAIWHTLKFAQSMTNASTTAFENIQELLKSVKSRMKYLTRHDIYDDEERKVFKSIVGKL